MDVSDFGNSWSHLQKSIPYLQSFDGFSKSKKVKKVNFILAKVKKVKKIKKVKKVKKNKKKVETSQSVIFNNVNTKPRLSVLLYGIFHLKSDMG
jgi:hypothetical protein